MEVEKSGYRVFYEIFRETIIQKEFVNRNQKPPNISALWAKVDQIRFKELFGDRSAAYFFLKFRDFKHRSKSTIDDSLFYRALLYIGIEAPCSIIAFSEKDPKEKAELLHREFIERYREEIGQEQPYQIENIYEDFNQETINPITKVEVLIKVFFDRMINGQQDKASELITENYVGVFAQGNETAGRKRMPLFRRIVKIKRLVVRHFKRPTPHMIECTAYIDSESAQITGKEIRQQQEITTSPKIYHCTCKLENRQWKIQRMIGHRIALEEKRFNLIEVIMF